MTMRTRVLLSGSTATSTACTPSYYSLSPPCIQSSKALSVASSWWGTRGASDGRWFSSRSTDDDHERSSSDQHHGSEAAGHHHLLRTSPSGTEDEELAPSATASTVVTSLALSEAVADVEAVESSLSSPPATPVTGVVAAFSSDTSAPGQSPSLEVGTSSSSLDASDPAPSVLPPPPPSTVPYLFAPAPYVNPISQLVLLCLQHDYPDRVKAAFGSNVPLLLNLCSDGTFSLTIGTPATTTVEAESDPTAATAPTTTTATMPGELWSYYDQTDQRHYLAFRPPSSWKGDSIDRRDDKDESNDDDAAATAVPSASFGGGMTALDSIPHMRFLLQDCLAAPPPKPQDDDYQVLPPWKVGIHGNPRRTVYERVQEAVRTLLDRVMEEREEHEERQRRATTTTAVQEAAAIEPPSSPPSSPAS